MDEQPIVRTGLRISLEKPKRHRVVGESANGESAVTDAQRLRPDVVLMDMRLPGMDDAEATWCEQPRKVAGVKARKIAEGERLRMIKSSG